MTFHPNIILITCHDIGQHLGCYGIKTVDTQAIDGLASEGVRFVNSFCTAPQCSPSRASIYTGRYPHNNGVMGLTHAFFAWEMNPGERHLAGILKSEGYKTCLIGHQHETIHPENMGFDNIISSAFSCDDIAESTAQYLKERNGSQPFYLQIGFFEPHRPFDVTGAKPDKSKGVTIPPYLVDDESSQKEFAEFQGAIRKVDSSIGKILKALDELGLTKDSITIYTSDHGIPFPRAKCSLYDPGIEVPFIIRWPKRGWIGGKVFNEIISNIDYLPTLLEAIGIAIPANVQGRSFASLLDGGRYGERKEIFAEITYHDYYDPRRCIRTKDWKLIANFSSAPFFMDPSQTWRPATVTKEPPEPAYAYHPDIELYDLKKDPLEFENAADNSAYEGITKELCGRLYGWMKETDDPLLQGVPLSPHHIRTMGILQAAGFESR